MTETYDCPAEGCDYTGNSIASLKAHTNSAQRYGDHPAWSDLQGAVEAPDEQDPDADAEEDGEATSEASEDPLEDPDDDPASEDTGETAPNTTDEYREQYQRSEAADTEDAGLFGDVDTRTLLYVGGAVAALAIVFIVLRSGGDGAAPKSPQQSDTTADSEAEGDGLIDVKPEDL